jgi:transposase-like protein
MAPLVGLRHGTCDAFLGVDNDLRYLIGRLRGVWPDVHVHVRGDSGLGVPLMYDVCRELRLSYTFGIGVNARLRAVSDGLMNEALEEYKKTGGWCLTVDEQGKSLVCMALLPCAGPLGRPNHGGVAMLEDLSRFCCLSEGCPDYGKRGAGNLTVCARYGKEKQRRMLYCRSCKARFSERKGTPLFGSQLTEEQALSIFEHLADRTGVRATARLVKVNRNTVVRYARLAGDHARLLHDERVAFSPEDP